MSSQLMTEPTSSQQRKEARPAVERIAAFAAAAQPKQLTPDIRQLYKRNILDSLGCAIAALPGLPFKALREQFDEYRAPGRCTQTAHSSRRDCTGTPAPELRPSDSTTVDQKK